MAFSKTWVETEPDGAVITVSQLDNYARDAKIAIRERLEGDAAAPLTGLYETGTFTAAPMVKKGSGRFYQGPISGIAGWSLQDGRGYFSSDAGNSHPKVYSMESAAAREIAYLNRDGSRPMLGTLAVNITHVGSVTSTIGLQSVIQTPAGGFTFTNITQVEIAELVKGIGSTITNLYGVRVLDQQGATNNYALLTGRGRVMFGNHADIDFTFYCDDNDNVILGPSNLIQSDTIRHVFIQSLPGPPNANPGAVSGHVALVYDTSTNRLYIYNGAWKFVAFT